MIFTSVSRLGDFLLLWPVASWYYKNTKDKIHWVLSENFKLYYTIEPLLRLQPFTQDVSFVNVGTDAYKDYIFNPSDFNIKGEYKNFGFGVYPSIYKYMSEFYAEMHGYGWDKDFIINLGEFDRVNNEQDYTVYSEASSYRNDYGIINKYIPTNCIKIDQSRSLIENIAFAKNAKEVYSPYNGFAIIMDMINKQCKIYGPITDYEVKNRVFKNQHEYYLI
jgi:hypothetical protein